MKRARALGRLVALGATMVAAGVGVPKAAYSQPDPDAERAKERSAAASGSESNPATPDENSKAPASKRDQVTLASGTGLRQSVPPPPAPTPNQLRALQLMQQEATEYRGGAEEFRNTLTLIVRHHYENKRRRILSALDGEIDIEKEALASARDEAIARLEKFIAMYSGENADPSATPDAMFRLAALYEERARSDFEADLAPGLEPAVDLYRRIIAEFPQYEELAAVHYYLGHAYTDSGRIEEGQQAWRALVCHNRYQVRQDPKDTGKIELQPLDQDHDQKFWTEWYQTNPLPMDENAIGGKRVIAVEEAPQDEELMYRDPYSGCEMIPQHIELGMDPRYVAEVWWQLGNYHFDQIDPAGGPYNLNRAVSAYDHSLEFEKPPLFGVAMYKQAWTYFKQQRYRRATEEFVRLLHYADEQEEKTGDPGADFRSEAYTYIAGSLTYVDFVGPAPSHPYIPRNDVLDLETDPLVAEQRMAVAIERVQDPEVIPQDKKWTVEIYKSLAQEFIEITQNQNAIAMLELTLEKFPLDRDAPVMRNKVADLYEQQSRLAPEGSAAREEYAGRALAARTKLKDYVGITEWTQANKDDPEALRQAEQLANLGLKRAAADHTNYAKAYYNRALELNEEGEQRNLIEKAIAEYRLAAEAWQAYYEQDQRALDAYESKFWLADAHFWVVVLQVALGRSPRADEVRMANRSAVDVRESNEDDKYLQPAAYYVVTIADKVLEDQYRLFEESEGRRGIEKVERVELSGEGAEARAVKKTIPTEVMATVTARDEYNARIPVDKDPERNGMLYAFQNADIFFVYGNFDEARKRYTPLYEAYCGKNEWGYKAWEKLISMSNFEGNTKESRRLAESKSCAVDEEQKAQEDNIRKPVAEIAAYMDAGELFDQAMKMKDGPERDKTWRKAAAAYKVALEKAPGNDSAPEAAMNGAYAYKQVGEYDKAIEMYELFIREYGSEEKLITLRDGDPKAEPPKTPDRAKYEERVKYLKQSYDALASAYVLFFNYPRAAETFEKISEIEHFENDKRRDAAQQALALYSSLGDNGGMKRARSRFASLGASPKEMAKADYIVAEAELKKWDQFSPNTGANGRARIRALQAMDGYYNQNRTRDAARQYVVHAAYWSSKMRTAAKAMDTAKWWDHTIRAFDAYKAVAPREGGKSTALGSVEASFAAEAEYTLIDGELVRKYDYESGFHRYKGTAVKVIGEYRKQAVVAKKYKDQLQHVVDAYLSPKWTTVAIARQGSVYDSLRTGLYNTRPPELQLFDANTERLLKRAEESGNLDLQEKADAVRVKVQQAWRDTREKELNSADEIMVTLYGQAVVLARRYNVSDPQVTSAIRRLAFFTDVIGEAKLQSYAAKVKDLNYTPGMFLKQRPGMTDAPKPDGMPAPLPVAVQP